MAEPIELESSDIRENISDDMDESEIALNNLISELGGDSETTVNIYKQPGTGKEKLEFLFAIEPQDYRLGPLLEKIRDEYGGGNYRVRVHQNGRILANRAISIAVPLTTNKSASDTAQLGGIIERLLDEQRKNTETIISRLENKKPELDIISVLGIAKDLFVQNVPVIQQAPDMMEMMQKFIVMQASMKDLMGANSADNGEANESGVLMKLIDQFGPTLADAAKQEQQTKREASRQINEQINANTKQAEKGNNEMKAQLMMLNKIASNDNNDPADYAGMVINAIPDKEQLSEFIMSPDSIDKLVKIYPPIAGNKEWFRELGDVIKVRTAKMSQDEFDKIWLQDDVQTDIDTSGKLELVDSDAIPDTTQNE